MRRSIFVLIAALVASMIATNAGAVVATTQPGSTVSGYTSPVFLHVRGESLTYVNLDIDVHDMRSDDKRSGASAGYCAKFPIGACPLFYSDLLGLGESGSVYGSEFVDSGLYSFYCTVHPWMTGILVVEG